MTPDNPLYEFDRKMAQAFMIRDSTPDTKQVEPTLVEILDWIRGHANLRDKIVQRLIELLESGSLESGSCVYHVIIEFLMHELRWPEIHSAVLSLASKPQNDLVTYWLDCILSAYTDDWRSQSGIIYRYYS